MEHEQLELELRIQLNTGLCTELLKSPDFYQSISVNKDYFFKLIYDFFFQIQYILFKNLKVNYSLTAFSNKKNQQIFINIFYNLNQIEMSIRLYKITNSSN
ncbi:hypothetical protein BpHYR1_021433 [Brachionus plicatilis]|uniref:Uncharacterized protein n=1 Tax=Brachionus plicatilis TaxID=10195 RepID=A0A3M7SU83_BRAPC|nr:hypothetical protein BpHYR1_021433 [Brachionus plicatilis]